MSGQSETESLYSSNRYAEQNSSLHDEDVDWKVRTLSTAVERFLSVEPSKNLSYLDVGGGTGRILANVIEFAGSRGRNVQDLTCVDLTPECLKLQRERLGSYPSRFVQESILDFNPAKAVDLMLLIHVIEHLHDYRLLLDRLPRLTRYVLIQLPLHRNFSEIAYDLLKGGAHRRGMADTIGHVHFFDLKAIRSELGRVGEILYEDIPDVNGYFLNSHYKQTQPLWFRSQARVGHLLHRVSPELSALFCHSFYTALVKVSP